MKKQIKNLLIISLAAVGLLFGLTLTAKAVNLQDAFKGQLSTVGQGSGFNISQNNIEPIIGNIISVALSFLGVIFLILMVYGGYIWMTAAGNEEKTKKAKQLIQAAVLGLVVVVGAYAITIFVMVRLGKSMLTGGGGNTSGSTTNSTTGTTYDPTVGSGTGSGVCCVVPDIPKPDPICSDIDLATCLASHANATTVFGKCDSVKGCPQYVDVGGGQTGGCCILDNPLECIDDVDSEATCKRSYGSTAVWQAGPCSGVIKCQEAARLGCCVEMKVIGNPPLVTYLCEDNVAPENCSEIGLDFYNSSCLKTGVNCSKF